MECKWNSKLNAELKTEDIFNDFFMQNYRFFRLKIQYTLLSFLNVDSAIQIQIIPTWKNINNVKNIIIKNTLKKKEKRNKLFPLMSVSIMNKQIRGQFSFSSGQTK
jgi:hypothetical protein